MFAGMAASFTMVVSGTIVNVAVPSVIGAFGIGLDQAQLITTGFNIAMVTSQLLSAWLVAAFGQRAGFLLMAAVFTLGSVIGGLGQTFDMVVVGRVLQGVAAGVIQPLVMVVAFQVFPADRRGYAMAIYSMGIFLAVAVGQMSLADLPLSSCIGDTSFGHRCPSSLWPRSWAGSLCRLCLARNGRRLIGSAISSL